MDLVGYFFRQAFNLLRNSGAFGLIATNTIAQGDTRSGGLRFICTHGGTIYSARRRYKWPGQAAVVVSVVWVAKASLLGPFDLNERPVPIITAYLFHAGGHEDPIQLQRNVGRSFKGSVVLGMGFTFDDTDKDGVATNLSQMARLITLNPHNAEVIFPYIGGEEFNNSPVQLHHRHIIDFGDMTEEQARRWPELFEIVETKVKPSRMEQKRDVYRIRWWQFAEKQMALYQAVEKLKRVLVIPEVSPHFLTGFLSSDYVFASTLYVFLFESFAAFAAFQSRPQEVWTRFLASSMKDDLRYVPSDCFEAFPSPKIGRAHV